MRGEALGPVMVRCPSVGEWQDREVGDGGLDSRGWGMGWFFSVVVCMLVFRGIEERDNI